MNHVSRAAIAAVLSVPAVLCGSMAPPAPAATVLVAEGTGQLRGTVETAFSGAFCKKNTCRSVDNARTPFDVALGSRQIQSAIQATPGDIILVGYSIGAASVYDRMRMWEQNPDTAPDPERVVLIVTLGNPENKFGGDDRKNAYAGLPDVQPYPHLDVTLQYDSVSDRPTRAGWYSMVNTSFARHLGYFEPVDINDPDNLIHLDADGTTYMLIKADVLPMLKWMDWFTTDERMAQLDAKYRPLVERDYDRPAYVPQGEGADWGNGIPPSTVHDVSGDADSGANADTPGRHKSGAGSGLTDEPDADGSNHELDGHEPDADEPGAGEPAADEPAADDLSNDLAGDASGNDETVEENPASATDAKDRDGGQADGDEAARATVPASQTRAAEAAGGGS